MPTDAAWYSNDVATIAAVISLLALVISVFVVLYARRQAAAAEEQVKAAGQQVKTAQEALELQREAAKSESENTSAALNLAAQNAQAGRLIAETAEKERLSRRAWITPEAGITIDRDGITNVPRSATCFPKYRSHSRAFINQLEPLLGSPAG